jgi:hypothetical protein
MNRMAVPAVHAVVAEFGPVEALGPQWREILNFAVTKPGPERVE